MKNKKILVIILCLILAVIGSVGGYLFYQNQQKQKLYDSITLEFIPQKPIEYGASVDPQSLIQKHSGEITLPKLDTKKLGKQTLIYKVTKEDMTKEFSYDIEIVDTKKPIITLKKDKDTLVVHSKCQVLDYIKSVKDAVDGELTYKKDVQKDDVAYFTYTGKVDTQKAGTYPIHIIAVDKNKNKSEKTLEITIQKKEIEKVSTPSSANSNQTTSQETKPSNQTISINKNKIICIDAGHQAKGMSSKEAVGPGSSTTKAKVSTGATGVASRVRESQINLEVALKLRSELQSRGYQVVMTRTSQNVSISNQQRAQIGNKANAGAVIHLHCDSTNQSSVRGAHTIAISKNNPYCSGLYSASSKLARQVINSYCAATGIKNRGVSYRNDLTGLNWSQVPSIYIEMGFISNPSEDRQLTNAEFQKKCAKGIANGIDKYFH